MAYVVTRRGATDEDFLECLRHLRGRKVDIGRAPRALDPYTGKRWLHAWQDRCGAAEVRDAVAAELDQPDWEVVEREAAGVGPLGPVPFYLAPRGDHFSFSLFDHARAILQSVHPEAVAPLSRGMVRSDDWEVFRKRRGGLDMLFRLVAPLLTGISMEHLDLLGYVAINDETRKTALSFPPGDAVQPAPAAGEVPSPAA